MTYPVHGGQLHAIAAAFGLPADDLLDFSASINPDGPPASVYTALRQALLLPATLTRYPDLEHTRLRAALSIHHGMGPECFTVANGFGPLLRAALEACSAPGAASTNHLPSRCMMPVPCFNEYRRTLEQARMTAIPYSLDPPSFCIEPADLLAAAARNACGSILLANLQNPSGTLHDAPLLRALVAEAASEGITVFLDEAFIDYAPEQSLTMFAAETSNLIVFRSVTKFFSIPGLRVAYAAANPQTIRNIGAQVASWPIDTLATAAVIAALEDEHFAVTSRARNRQRRTQLQAQLEAIGIRVYPAAANFLLLRLPTQLAGDTWQRLILEHRIVTRDCSGFEGLGPGHLRVAVLHESRNSRLVDAFSNLL